MTDKIADVATSRNNYQSNRAEVAVQRVKYNELLLKMVKSDLN